MFNNKNISIITRIVGLSLLLIGIYFGKYTNQEPLISLSIGIIGFILLFVADFLAKK